MNLLTYLHTYPFHKVPYIQKSSACTPDPKSIHVGHVSELTGASSGDIYNTSFFHHLLYAVNTEADIGRFGSGGIVSFCFVTLLVLLGLLGLSLRLLGLIGLLGLLESLEILGIKKLFGLFRLFKVIRVSTRYWVCLGCLGCSGYYSLY